MTANLTIKQKKALETLLQTGSVTAAAAMAEVSRETLYRWMEKDSFQAAIAAAESEALKSLSRSLLSLGEMATQTLETVMSDKTAPAGVRVRSADVVLGRLLQLRELNELEERISKLEAQLCQH
jgi:hypothetical protein